MDEVKRTPAKKARKVTPVLLKKGFWLTDKKIEKGNVIKVTIEQAKQMIAADVAERADPLDGEDDADG